MLGVLLAAALVQEAPKTFTARVPSSTIVKRIKSIFGEVSLQLGPDSLGADGKTVPGCSIQFGASLANKRVAFSVPQKSVSLGIAGTMTYAPNGIFIRNTSVRTTKKEYEVVLYFDSNGPALKGTHSWLGDGGAPDISLEHAHVIVRMKPTTKDGKIHFDKPVAMFYADMKTEGLSFNLLGRPVDLVQSATGYRQQIKTAIETQLVAALDGSGARKLLSEKIQDIVSNEAAGFGARVVRLGLSGMDLMITLTKRGKD